MNNVDFIDRIRETYDEPDLWKKISIVNKKRIDENNYFKIRTIEFNVF